VEGFPKENLHPFSVSIDGFDTYQRCITAPSPESLEISRKAEKRTLSGELHSAAVLQSNKE
jgi:hypothetical protein